MVAYTELLPFAKVGAALTRTVLFEQAIDAATNQLPE